MRDKFELLPNIPVSNIQLDTNNFRIGTAANQRDCIGLMFVDKRAEHMIALAKDIAERGLSPNPIVVVKNDKGGFTVKDGNRRVTALKLLNNPSEAPDNYKATFSALSENANAIISESINCYLTDEDTALSFMELSHLGFQGGIGQIKWGSNEKDNLNEFKGVKLQNNVARAVLTYLKSIGIPETDNIKITIFQRLFQDKDVRDLIGIEWENEILSFSADEESVANILTEIFLDFTERGSTTLKIFTDKDRLKYINELFARGVPKPKPADTEVGSSSKQNTSEQGELAGTSESNGAVKASKPLHAPDNAACPAAKPSWDRKNLIPKRCRLGIPKSATKASNIAHELSHGIEVKKAPNAAAVLLRLLIEFSIDNYISNHDIAVPKDKDKLYFKASKVAEDLSKGSYINQKEFENLNKLSQNDAIFSAHTLNAWVHHSHYSPDPQTLCTFWENIEKFISLCWTK
ncbi:ParB/Srx family N-terminal domain-containing protein [Desulfovibrio sp. 86]|uniref:Uncharacterized protein n=1 Tax=uncultured Desulfovibrio sp. TaxID=167968 RepID=A0A212KXN5_9BACT|nr:ParB/Srx family N-terminal domain-containing protein [Desulfovibrio sp. 86]SCM70016.1 conserved hypothetical protein [uncultured Desulfovibrio sp.]VZH35346.1 conserved protein of unknown function [Desulfovibrio sp. 86]